MKGLNMEIRKTSMATPAFGMAFIKPKGKEYEAFTKEISRNKKVVMVKKGLKQIVQRADKNTRYNVEYQLGADGNSLYVVKPAKDNSVIATFPSKQTSYPGSYQKTIDELDKLSDHGFKTVKEYLKGIYLAIKLTKNVLKVRFFKQEEIMPDAMRKAVDVAENFAKKEIRANERQIKIANAVNSAFEK
jgi:hypothetical protein